MRGIFDPYKINHFEDPPVIFDTFDQDLILNIAYKIASEFLPTLTNHDDMHAPIQNWSEVYARLFVEFLTKKLKPTFFSRELTFL